MLAVPFCTESLSHAGYVKAHDWMTFVTVLGMWAMRGLSIDPKYLLVWFTFCDLASRLTADRIYAEDLPALEQDVTEFLCLLERTFPATELTIVFHLMQHLVLYLQLWGPLTRYWMFPIERFLGFLVRKIKNRAHPEANVTNQYQLFRSTLLYRREIERSLASSAHFNRYSRLLDTAHKLSASGEAIAGSKFDGGVRVSGQPTHARLTDEDYNGLVAMLRLHFPNYDQLLRDWEADVRSDEAKGGSAAPLPATWFPAGRVITSSQREMLCGPDRAVVGFPRAAVGGVTFRAGNKVPGSAASR
jgi:hypothetical protein